MSNHPTGIAASFREEHPGCFSKGLVGTGRGDLEPEAWIRQAVIKHGRYVKIGQDGPATIVRPV